MNKFMEICRHLGYDFHSKAESLYEENNLAALTHYRTVFLAKPFVYKITKRIL